MTMATITEDYVSFETAKLLKKKGFDVWGDGSFNSGIEVFAEYSPSGTFNKCITSKPHQKAYPAPTLQMAMKWLREVHNLFIQVWIISEQGYWFNIDKLSDNYNHKDLYSTGLEDIYYPTYEETVEAAIKYCLENLI